MFERNFVQTSTVLVQSTECNPKENRQSLSPYEKKNQGMTLSTSKQSKQAAGHENYYAFLRVGQICGERLFCWLQSDRNSLNISSASSLKIQRRRKKSDFDSIQLYFASYHPTTSILTYSSITSFCHSCDIPSLHQSFSVCLTLSLLF